VRLRQPERLRHLCLGPFQEEPLEHELALAPVERPGRARDERSVEAQLVEGRRCVRRVVVVERCRENRTAHRPRRPHHRRAVAQMAQELTLDAPRDVGRKLDGPRRVSAIDGADDRERRDLDEILMALV